MALARYYRSCNPVQRASTVRPPAAHQGCFNQRPPLNKQILKTEYKGPLVICSGLWGNIWLGKRKKAILITSLIGWSLKSRDFSFYSSNFSTFSVFCFPCKSLSKIPLKFRCNLRTARRSPATAMRCTVHRQFASGEPRATWCPWHDDIKSNTKTCPSPFICKSYLPSLPNFFSHDQY